MEGYNTISTPAVAADGSVYAATDKDNLYKFSPKGKLMWTQQIVSDPDNKSRVYVTPTIDEDGTVYIAAGSSSGMASCVAFNPDGSRKWTFTDFWSHGPSHQAAITGGMAAIGKHNIYIGNNGSIGTLLAISKLDGTRVGHIASGSGGPTGGVRSGAVLSNSGMVHWFGGKYGVWGASRARLDKSPDGCPYYWNQYITPSSRATTNNLSSLGCMKVNDRDCIIGVMTDKTSTKVYAVDAASGTEVSLVRISDTGVQDQGGVVVTADGYIVAPLNCEEGKSNGGIVIVDPISSTVKMRFELQERVSGAPAVDASGNIHFFTENGIYYIVKPDYASGVCELKARVDLAQMISSDRRYRKLYGEMSAAKVWSSAVIGSDGKIYTCFTDLASLSYGGVVCLSYGDCVAPAASDWPMIGGDPCHTSRQKGLVIDAYDPVEVPEIDLTPYPSLLADDVRSGKTLTSVFDGIIAGQKDTKTRSKVYIVAHRANTCAGVAAGCPDNSIAAIQMAIKSGTDMVELDVRTTKDGHLVLMHDATIDATTDGSGKVSDYTLEQLKAFSMERGGVVYVENGQPARVPTLEEALNACKGKMYINLDLKHVASPADLVQIIQKTGMQDQVMLFCGGAAAVEYQRLDSRIALHPYIGKASDIDQYVQYETAKLFQYGFDQWVDGYSIAKDVRLKGYLTYSNILNYDVQTQAGNYIYIEKFIKSETDFIQTDCCELIATCLRAERLR